MKTAYLCPTKEHFIYQVKEFLKTTTWASGSADVEDEYWNEEEKTCVTVDAPYELGKIIFNSKIYFQSKGYEIRTVELPKEEWRCPNCDTTGCICTMQFNHPRKPEPNKPMNKIEEVIQDFNENFVFEASDGVNEFFGEVSIDEVRKWLTSKLQEVYEQGKKEGEKEEKDRIIQILQIAQSSLTKLL